LKAIFAKKYQNIKKESVSKEQTRILQKKSHFDQKKIVKQT